MMVSTQDGNGPEAYIQQSLTPLDAPSTKSHVYQGLLAVSPVADRRGCLYDVAGTCRMQIRLKKEWESQPGVQDNQPSMRSVYHVSFTLQQF